MMRRRFPRRGLTLKQIVWSIVAVVALFAVVRNAIVKTPQQAIAAEYAPKFEALHTKLQKAVDQIPAESPTEDLTPETPLSPLPDSTNTIVMSIEPMAQARAAAGDDKALKQLVPDKRLGDDNSDLVYRWRPDLAVQTAFREIGYDTLPKRYDQFLAARYLVAVKFLNWIPPKRDEHGPGLIAGRAEVAIYLFDLESGKLLGTRRQDVIQHRGIVSSSGDPVQTASDQLADLVGDEVAKSVNKMAGGALSKNPLHESPPYQPTTSSP